MAAMVRSMARSIALEGIEGFPLGTCPDRCYPKEHTELFEQISEHGMILSEYPLGTSAYPSHFPRRNRLIAAWSDEMHVIEAGRNSETLTTKQYFEKYHR